MPQLNSWSTHGTKGLFTRACLFGKIPTELTIGALSTTVFVLKKHNMANKRNDCYILKCKRVELTTVPASVRLSWTTTFIPLSHCALVSALTSLTQVPSARMSWMLSGMPPHSGADFFELFFFFLFSFFWKFRPMRMSVFSRDSNMFLLLHRQWCKSQRQKLSLLSVWTRTVPVLWIRNTEEITYLSILWSLPSSR